MAIETNTYKADHPLFFLHIPRTGGTTLDAILFKNFEKNKILKIYSKKEYEEHKTHTLEEIRSLRYITGHLLLDTYDPPTLYTVPINAFTLLRDPVERLVSEYIFYKNWPNQHLYKIIHEKRMTFSEYIQSMDQMFKYRGKNFMTRCLSGMPFKAGSFPYAALAFAKRQLERNFFFFGLMERFDESLLILQDILHLDTVFYEKRNTLARGTKNEITESDRELAKEANKADIHLYAFAKEVFAERVNTLGKPFTARLLHFKEMNKEYQMRASALYESTHGSENGSIVHPKNELW